MWDYKVVSGHYNVDGANVFLKNPAGEGTLQVVLDHYGNDRWELVSTSFDNVHREVVLVFKRPRGGAAAPATAVPGFAAAAAPQPVYHAPAAAAPAAAAAVFNDPELGTIKRRTPGSGPAGPAPQAPGRGGRRSKADLDKLARED